MKVPARELNEQEQLREDNIKRNNALLEILFPTTVAAITTNKTAASSETTIVTNSAPVEVLIYMYTFIF